MNKLVIRVAIAVPISDDELFDYCAKSNGEGELDVIGSGYYDIELSLDEVKSLVNREGFEFVDDGYLFINGDDLEKDYDNWFIEKKKEKYGRYDIDPLFNEEDE